MAKAVKKIKVYKQTIEDMQKLGIYKPEYNRIIDIYSELVAEYSRLNEEFKTDGYKYEVSTDQGGSKKSPIVATLETLRKDILAYSDRLGLNPKALETVTVEKANQSKLAAVFSNLE